ncbi:PilT/PilU family type 4a pilus ATPase [Bdellovibrionota bacterium FG-1]
MNESHSPGTRVALAVVEKDAEKATQPQVGQIDPRIDIKYLIRALLKYNASDLHLKPGRPPLYRINGKVVPAKMAELNERQIQHVIFAVLSQRQKIELDEKRQVDLSFRVEDLGRFRCNVYFQKGQLAAAIRMVPLTVPRLDSLGVPEVLKELCFRQRGLLLITGSTGSGKSTTLAAIVQHINESSHSHILTIEDPIEFVHKDLKATISQREVGSDVLSLHEGLYGGLRQDPDVIVIGELRDKEMIQGALTAAETGHLVISTLHTNDARSTIDRIIDGFPSDGQAQVRIQLSAALIGVVSQQLLVKADGTGRICVSEVMVKSPAIEQYILNDELARIPEAIATSNHYYQMRSMNQALESLVTSGAIRIEDAVKASNNPDDLRLLLAGVSREQGY